MNFHVGRLVRLVSPVVACKGGGNGRGKRAKELATSWSWRRGNAMPGAGEGRCDGDYRTSIPREGRRDNMDEWETDRCAVLGKYGFYFT